MSETPQMPTRREFSDAIIAGIQDRPEAYKLCWSIVCRVLECVEDGQMLPPHELRAAVLDEVEQRCFGLADALDKNTAYVIEQMRLELKGRDAER